jgi:hypothetical protein
MAPQSRPIPRGCLVHCNNGTVALARCNNGIVALAHCNNKAGSSRGDDTKPEIFCLVANLLVCVQLRGGLFLQKFHGICCHICPIGCAMEGRAVWAGTHAQTTHTQYIELRFPKHAVSVSTHSHTACTFQPFKAASDSSNDENKLIADIN